ncbi:MAG TPA: cytochrome c [Longimicrobiales bacterium]|nr:cytochrome c [Longimicrobiales bacterium]
MSAITRSLSVLAALGVAACASSGGQMQGPAPAPAAAPAAAAPAAAAPAPESAAPAGLFSAAQANRGRDQFRSMCTECHTAGEFSDQSFKVKWSRRSVGDLYEFIHTAMPDDAPGILTEAQAVDLVSYILDMNGFESGSRQMQADQAELDQISLSSLRS